MFGGNFGGMGGKGLGMALGGQMGNQMGSAPGGRGMVSRGSFSPMGFAMGRPGMSSIGNAAGSAIGGRGMAPTMMAGLGALSDEESKTRIRELEDELSRTYAALSGPSATGGVNPSEPDTAALDAAYRRPTSNSYDYKDPTAPGAAPGRQAGPMADELKGLPGVVAPGPDGLDRVDTGRLTMTNASEIANLRRELDALNGRIGSGQSNPDGTF